MKKTSLVIVIGLLCILSIGYYWRYIVLPQQKETALIAYGQDLIAHTSKYFGPKGKLQYSTNGMNCQNCHLESGTKTWGLNYIAVYRSYPKYRARSGTVESIYKRVNDCFERSLNGKALDTTSKEMQAIYAYIKSLGKTRNTNQEMASTSLATLPFLPRAASPEKGEPLFIKNCQSCHGRQGQGLLDSTTATYVYPPLWGAHSYNNAAGLFQISKLASFIKNNMPNAVTYQKPVLTDQEAWDVAAYINSQPRPQKNVSKDFPNKAEKPIDYPFGPYSDDYSEQQHKYGPFGMMQSSHKK